MIEKYWLELENKFYNVKLHDFVVMPNHFHGVVEIIHCNKCRGRSCVCPDNVDDSVYHNINNDNINKNILLNKSG